MSLLRFINEMARGMNLSPDHEEVARRLADYWRERADDMTDDELSEAVAMDMENIAGVEGDPELIDKLVPIVVAMVRGV